MAFQLRQEVSWGSSLQEFSQIKRENGQGAYRSSVPAFTMADKLAKTNPHCGLLRFVLRAPLLLYRIRLGGVLDDRFLLLKHTGREAACSGERFWRSWLR
jgi:hypothetical protein